MQNAVIPVQGDFPVRVVPPAVLDRMEQEQFQARAGAQQTATQPYATGLASYIRTQFEIMRNHRNNSKSGWNERMLAALRAFNGVYSANMLAEIQRFGGSTVYAKIVGMKCRGATTLLRDVYLSPDRPWGISPNPDPEVPEQIKSTIEQLVQAEVTSMQQAGAPVDPSAIQDRINQLMMAARDAAKAKAMQQARVAEDKIDELLREGNFYRALAEFLVDLPIFPFACIKGPVVRIVPSVVWENGRAIIKNKPRLFWQRISGFDLWWTPGVSDIEDAATIEKSRLTRADLNDLLDLPGYDTNEVRAVLDEYGRGGLVDNWDSTDAERADQEGRENPMFNRSGMISCLEFNGNVQGRMLLEQGVPIEQIPDPLRDYMVQAWLIGTHVIKVQFSPSPRKRHPYFISSFEKVPGTPLGNALPDILGDIQDICNATARALVNNLSIASGPQVVLNVERLAPDEDPEDMYPWKRWRTTSDPMNSGSNASQGPVSFYPPVSNASELLAVYEKFNTIADDLSAIPRYLQGSNAGGAGRTASGLAMLMGNASKMLQTVAANVDRDVISPCLQQLSDLILLTDTSGLLTGEESIRVLGVQVAVQRETERSRQLEFLQITNNPVDQQIMGPKGRATVLRSVSKTIGLDGEQVVPSSDQIDKQMQAQAAMAQQQAEAAAQAQGNQPGRTSTGDMGPRTNLQQKRPGPVSGGVH